MRVLIIPGSIRTGSHNGKLANAAHRLLMEAGAPATLLDLRDYDMPLYNGDIEAASGLPENALKLREVLGQHQALLVVSPEYNNSIPPLLKNSLDWVSRTSNGVSGAVFFRGKPTAMMSASPGHYGGLRSLIHLRQVLNAIGALVIPEQFSLSNADKAFDADGRLLESRAVDGVEKVLKSLTDLATKLSA